MDTIDHLRTATEDDVVKAMVGAGVEFPLQNPADLLEAYNRILDLMLGVPEE